MHLLDTMFFSVAQLVLSSPDIAQHDSTAASAAGERHGQHWAHSVRRRRLRHLRSVATTGRAHNSTAQRPATGLSPDPAWSAAQHDAGMAGRLLEAQRAGIHGAAPGEGRAGGVQRQRRRQLQARRLMQRPVYPRLVEAARGGCGGLPRRDSRGHQRATKPQQGGAHGTRRLRQGTEGRGDDDDEGDGAARAARREAAAILRRRSKWAARAQAAEQQGAGGRGQEAGGGQKRFRGRQGRRKDPSRTSHGGAGPGAAASGSSALNDALERLFVTARVGGPRARRRQCSSAGGAHVQDVDINGRRQGVDVDINGRRLRKLHRRDGRGGHGAIPTTAALTAALPVAQRFLPGGIQGSSDGGHSDAAGEVHHDLSLNDPGSGAGTLPGGRPDQLAHGSSAGAPAGVGTRRRRRLGQSAGQQAGEPKVGLPAATAVPEYTCGFPEDGGHERREGQP